MGQVIKFFGWILIGVAATLVFVGVLAISLVHGEKGFILMTDPVSIVILFAAFIPGGGMLLLSRYLIPMDIKDKAIREAARRERQTAAEADEKSRAVD